jgi:hypothetical protein
MFRKSARLKLNKSLPKIKYEFPAYKRSSQQLRSILSPNKSQNSVANGPKRRQELKLLETIKDLKEEGKLKVCYKERNLDDYFQFILSGENGKDSKYQPEKITLLVLKNTEKAI